MAQIAAIGAGATIVMDVWLQVLKRVGIPIQNFAMLGRWIGHWADGQWHHTAIASAGVAFGLFLAFFHAAWAGLVAAGQAQKFLDFIFWAHFIAPPYQIQPFEITRAAILIGITFLVGLTLGVVGALFWNMSTRRA